VGKKSGMVQPDLTAPAHLQHRPGEPRGAARPLRRILALRQRKRRSPPRAWSITAWAWTAATRACPTGRSGCVTSTPGASRARRPVGVALAALMRPGSEGRVALKLAIVRKLGAGVLDDARGALLIDCVSDPMLQHGACPHPQGARLRRPLRGPRPAEAGQSDCGYSRRRSDPRVGNSHRTGR